MSWQVGVKNLTWVVVSDGGVDCLCSNILPPDIRRTCWVTKIGMKRNPMRALKLLYSSKCIVFQGEAIRDDGRSPKPL